MNKFHHTGIQIDNYLTMKTSRSFKQLFHRFGISLLVFLLMGTFLSPAQAQIAIQADTLYTMEDGSAPIINGVVLVNNGKIEQIGSQSDITVPNSYERHSASVVTPGLIDAHSVVGLAGIYNQDHDQDQLETSSPIQPELRAIDAYNSREELVDFVRSLGVTTLHTGHGPGALISGQTMIVKTGSPDLRESLIDSTAMLAMTLGNGISREFKSPGTDAKGIAMLRQTFIKAQEYAEKMNSDNPPSRDLAQETLVHVLNGEIPAMITAQTATEINAAIRLAEEFGFKLVLDGAAESYLIMEVIRKAEVPVFVHPTMVRNYGGTKNAKYTTAAELQTAGIPFAFQSGYEGYVPKSRIVLFEAAIASANGLNRVDALASLTREPAEILGIADRVGTLEPGKDADIVLYDGDPLEYTTHVTKVFINGRLASHKQR
ncbi:MAG: amidohydrolase family protein [Bacteroidota bacterium]